MNVRERFEEIWPVPEGVYWHEGFGEYMPVDPASEYHLEAAVAIDLRLDTFTRCQESMGPVLSLVEELVYELETAYTASGVLPGCVERARKIIWREK